MRSRRVALFLLATTCLLACSKSLTRSSAADLIKANATFEEPMSVKLPVGKIWFDFRNFYNFFPIRNFERIGLINVFETGRTSGMWSKEYVVRLTSKGESEKAKWEATDEKINSWFSPPSPEATIYLVPIATRKLDEITGIRTPGDEPREAVAEFSWHWEPTQTGQELEKNPPTQKQETEALFQLYDDGWRVGRLKLTIFD